MKTFGVCGYCRKIISCYPKPDCIDCNKECKLRGKHSIDFLDIKIRFGGECENCYEKLLKDLEIR